MQVGYLRSSGRCDALKEKLAVLEKAGCDRIVMDHGSLSDEPAELILLISGSLQAGDTLVVCGMEDVASSLSQLVSFLLDLDSRKVRFRSLSEGLDTAGKQGEVARTFLRKLQTFEERAEDLAGQAASRRRRAGRPKSLCAQDIDEVRKLLQQGESISELAEKFRVSKATLYRYLGR
jgi:DNA invertase Pin-like site-specific DNA recombinase